MPTSNHPIWEIARLATLGVIAIGALYVCATQFDETEWKAIGMIMGGGGAASMGISWMQQRAENVNQGRSQESSAPSGVQQVRESDQSDRDYA